MVSRAQALHCTCHDLVCHAMRSAVYSHAIRLSQSQTDLIERVHEMFAVFLTSKLKARENVMSLGNLLQRCS